MPAPLRLKTRIRAKAAARPGVRAGLPAILAMSSLVVLPAAPAFAASPTGLGVDHFLQDGARSAVGSGMSGMSDTLLSDLLRTPAYKDCKVDHIEVRARAERQRELDLSRQPGLVDPSTRLVDRTIPTGHLITGTVSERGGTVSWTVNMVDAVTGKIVGTSTASATDMNGVESSLRESLRALLDKICPRAYHMKASTGPYFQIDTEFCGIDQPFAVKPKGKFAGVTLRFTPKSDGAGTFTQSGTAYGAKWTGGGEYTIDWKGDSGRLVARDGYTAQVGAGKSDNPNDQMTGTVTRLNKSCKR